MRRVRCTWQWTMTHSAIVEIPEGEDVEKVIEEFGREKVDVETGEYVSDSFIEVLEFRERVLEV